MTLAGEPSRPRVVVIGAGVAGSVVAARLAGQCDVVVLERGASSTTFDDPTLAMKGSGFESTPYPQGIGPGGSSRVNGMVFEPAPDEYWGSLVRLGLDVFADARDERAKFVSEVSPGDGVIDRALLGALAGARPSKLATHNGVRLTAWDRMTPRKCTLHTDVTVSHLKMQGEQAIGVVTERGDEVSADHVILCAGAIHSAGIASRSGLIGEETQFLDHPALFIPLIEDERGFPKSMSSTFAGALHLDDGVLTMSINGGAEGSGGLLVALMTPRSSGRLHFKNDSVSIDRGLLTDVGDLEAMTKAVRRVERLLNQPSFSHLRIPMKSLLDGDQWRERVGDGMWHASGTLPMGVEESASLDQSGRFHGTSNVWCMDASVFPVIPPVPPQTSVMVAAGLLSGRFLSLSTN